MVGALAAVPAIGAVLLILIFLLRFTSNDSRVRYAAISPTLPGLVEAIKHHTGEGRVLFTGFVLHELDGGHVTPLPALTGKLILASRYQHDRWEYTDIIPVDFRNRGADGIESFFDLHNVSAVIAHDPTWRRYLDRVRDRYRRRWKGGRFVLYTRAGAPNSYFMEGEGSLLRHDARGVIFSLQQPSAVLRFHFHPNLQAIGCEKITPHQIHPEVVFIRASECILHRPIELKIRSPSRKLLR